jgi:hypothetical protein
MINCLVGLILIMLFLSGILGRESKDKTEIEGFNLKKELKKPLNALEKKIMKPIKPIIKIVNGVVNFFNKLGIIFKNISAGIAKVFKVLFLCITCVDDILIGLIIEKYTLIMKKLSIVHKIVLGLFFTFIIPIIPIAGILWITKKIYDFGESIIFPSFHKQRIEASKKCALPTIKNNWDDVINTFPTKEDWEDLIDFMGKKKKKLKKKLEEQRVLEEQRLLEEIEEDKSGKKITDKVSDGIKKEKDNAKTLSDMLFH